MVISVFCPFRSVSSLMKKVILITFPVCSEALDLNLRDAAWVSIESSFILCFPRNIGSSLQFVSSDISA